MPGNWFSSFFSWPTGGVWSNLLASVIWTLPALRLHHRSIKRHITSALAQQAAADAPNREAPTP